MENIETCSLKISPSLVVTIYFHTISCKHQNNSSVFSVQRLSRVGNWRAAKKIYVCVCRISTRHVAMGITHCLWWVVAAAKTRHCVECERGVKGIRRAIMYSLELVPYLCRPEKAKSTISQVSASRPSVPSSSEGVIEL